MKTPSCAAVAPLLMIAYALLPPPDARGDASPPVEQESIIVWSEGVRLAGDLFKPSGLRPGARLPGILLIHGWGGVKQHLNRAYAPQLAARGFIVLTFDYKGWGKSNGPLLVEQVLPASDEAGEVSPTATHVRRIVNPLSMLEDARAALNYLAGEPQVMSDNLGVWGTSLGGGIGLVTAARDDRVKAYVDQIGAVNFQANLEMITDEMVRRWEVQRARGMIPPYPGAESIVNPVLEGYPDWIYMKRFDSFAYAERLEVPTLIIDAEDEELFARESNGLLLHAALEGRVETKYVTYPGKHYDIYSGEQYRGALRDAGQWFVEHLKGIEGGGELYSEHCASCHSNPQVNAPAFGVLRTMTSDAVSFALEEGTMKAQAASLSAEERRNLTKYLSAGSKDPRAWEEAMRCSASTELSAEMVATVRGWGHGTDNRRFQPAELAGIRSGDLTRLELAWALGLPGATEMRSQPVIADDTLYVGVESVSAVYALDLKTGCLRWAYAGTAPVRSALGFARMPDSNAPVLFYGDVSGSVHVVDAVNGTRIWTASLELPSATITGSPVPHGDRLYVPISTFEVALAGRANYECCKAHGGVRALDLRTGDTLWTYTTTAAAKATGRNASGTRTWGPSGAPVWTTPAIDARRNRLYIGTGENYSRPATGTSDAIIALDLDTGQPAWVFQTLEDDVYNMDCRSYLGFPDGPNCPKDPGPDFDFGASVVIATTEEGEDILLAAQKSGDVYGLDPDRDGAVVWHTRLSDGTPVGGVHWGMAVAGQRAFVPIADPDWEIEGWEYEPRPGVVALDVSTGKLEWRHSATRGCVLDESITDPTTGRQQERWPECPFFYGFSGAATAIDGAVLAGSLDGTLHAFDTRDGSPLWQFDTNRSFDTLNGEPAHGGSLDNAGPVLGNGYFVLQSGYSYINQMPGNALLVFRKRAD
jgi:polyvinyl alcohol dehydrogenase (cytochrome)